MTMSKTTVTGPVYLPSGMPPKNPRIVFELTSWDKEDGEASFVSGPFAADIDTNGDFSVELWSSQAGANGAVYRVSVTYQGDLVEAWKNEYLGTISLSGAGPFRLDQVCQVDEKTVRQYDVLAQMAATQLAMQAGQDNINQMTVLRNETQTARDDAAQSAGQAATTAAGIGNLVGFDQDDFHRKDGNLAGIVDNTAALGNLEISDAFTALLQNSDLKLVGDLDVTDGSIKQGVYQYITIDSSGGPVSVSQGIVQILRRAGTEGEVQILYDIATSDTWVRSRGSGAWKDWVGGRSTTAQAEAGTDNNTVMTPKTTKEAISEHSKSGLLAILSDTKPQGSSSQGYTTGAWTKHDITRVKFDVDNTVTLADSHITFHQAGYVKVALVGRDGKIARLWNETDGVEVLEASQMTSSIGGGGSANCHLIARVEKDKEYFVETYANTAYAIGGWNITGREEEFLTLEFYN